MEQQGHTSVLFTESIEGLALMRDDVVVDATIGGAGHFGALFSALGADGVLIGIDADKEATERAEAYIKASPRNDAPETHILTDDFRNLESILDTLGKKTIDKALFDLGWSSYHLVSGRGFSFRTDEPLLMTYGEPEEGKTAADIVNTSTEEALADVLYTYGEERFARAIARSIVRTRGRERILTTGALADAVVAGVPAWYRNRRIHPATKTFQALRIAVNDELGAIRVGVGAALKRLSPGGRVAVITFHSIEDRIVKGLFRDAAYAGQGTLVNRKPIIPGDAERMSNPRARSAKLRIFERGNAHVHATEARTISAYA